MLKGKFTRKGFFHNGLLAVLLAASLLVLCFYALSGVFNVPNASAVNTSGGVGVFWDSGCTNPVTSISWGNVSAGSETDVTVYLENLGPDALTPTMNMSDLTPSTAYLQIYLVWNYGGQQLASGQSVNVTLRLFVSPSVSGISSFSFNVNFGTDLYKSPDILKEGIVGPKDLTAFALAWETVAGGPNYDYRCDFNNDGIVNGKDLVIFALHWEQPE